MFLFVINRNGKTHIVDYYSNYRYRVICGEVLYKKNHITTLSADNTFNYICKNCRKYYDDMYNSDLNCDPRMAYGEPRRLPDLLLFNSVGFFGPQEDYLLSVNRVWSKFNRYKQLINRNKKIYG